MIISKDTNSYQKLPRNKIKDAISLIIIENIYLTPAINFIFNKEISKMCYYNFISPKI